MQGGNPVSAGIAPGRRIAPPWQTSGEAPSSPRDNGESLQRFSRFRWRLCPSSDRQSSNAAFSFSVVPDTEALTGAIGIHAPEEHAQRLTPEMASGMHAKFPPGRHHWFAQDFESAELFQSHAQEDFFAREIGFVEAADGF